MNALRTFLAAKGYDEQLSQSLNTPDFVRFDRSKPASGFFKAKVICVGGQDYIKAYFGDWALGEKHEFTSDLPTDAQDLASVKGALGDFLAKERAEKEARQEAVALDSQKFWAATLPSAGNHPYLVRKQLRGPVTASVHELRGELLVPCRDIDGKLWGTQRILSDGSKFFTPGQRVKGVMHVIGTIEQGSAIYVGEGIATAGSIHMSTQLPTVCAFNASNLPSVCQALRSRYPDSRIVVCADNDAFTKRADGTDWNPGLEYAEQACERVRAEIRVPTFSDVSTRPTDFNDLHCLLGLDEVTKQLESGSDGESSTTVVRGSAENMDLTPLAWKKGKGDVMKPPAHQKFVEALLAAYGENICKQTEDVFVYNGVRWIHHDKLSRDVFLRQFQYLYSNQAGFRVLKDLLNLFLTYIPAAPLDMFGPRHLCANFLNGVLWLNRTKDHKYSLDFHPGHRREDYLLRVLPYNYDENCQEGNAEFDAMLERVFLGDSDKADKISAVGQMYGACLMSFWPQLFMLHGKPGTGKSTIALIASRLVSAENLCSVDPTQFKGFNMETMVGKLVNIDTDISTRSPIVDDQVKKIIDRRNFRVARKHKGDLDAPIPATHIFCGNGIPPTLEGYHKAHDRRWTFLEFSAFVPAGRYDKEYWDYCFEVSPQGILNFAVKGLRDLVGQGGHYARPASSVEKMAEWQMSSDIVGQFLGEIKSGELVEANSTLKQGKGRISPTKFWDVFVTWQKSSDPSGRTAVNKGWFFQELKAKNVLSKKSNGVRYYDGMTLGVVEGGQF